jgi:hypothetical protein
VIDGGLGVWTRRSISMSALAFESWLARLADNCGDAVAEAQRLGDLLFGQRGTQPLART